MIPTRAKLIERVEKSTFPRLSGYPHDGPDVEEIADFTLAEIRRAVAEELEALRKADKVFRGERCTVPVERMRWIDAIDARLAALRAEDHIWTAEEIESAERVGEERYGPLFRDEQAEQPPGAATVAEPRSDRAKTSYGAAGSTPAPGATGSAESDARALERSVEILNERRLCEDARWEMLSLVDELRAAAPEPEVDVFEAAASEIYDACDQVCGSDDVATTAKILKARFSPLVEALEKIESETAATWVTDECKAALSALRRRATEARS